MINFSFQSINGVILCINEECIITFVAEHFKHVFGLEPVSSILFFSVLMTNLLEELFYNLQVFEDVLKY